MTTIVTGGLGYLGSHMVARLMEAGEGVVILDNLQNSCAQVFSNLGELWSKLKDEQPMGMPPIWENVSLLDLSSLHDVLECYDFDTVYHFAGHKSVPESMHRPMLYLGHNVEMTTKLLEVMADHHQKKRRRLIYSSSAAVYGNQLGHGTLNEHLTPHPNTPYGRGKWICEQIIREASTQLDIDAVCLRYFNPVGAHDSGLIGEYPFQASSNLMPRLANVAAGTQEQLSIYGSDWRTRDGTCVRDYIHVLDLIEAHWKASEWLNNLGPGGRCMGRPLNLGTGQGTTVKELVGTYSYASDQKIPSVYEDRRYGDVATLVADPSEFMGLTGWQPVRNLHDMCSSSWKWRTGEYYDLTK